MSSLDSGEPPPVPPRADGCPPLVGRFGSLAAFWPLIEPILALLRPRRLCEVGVEKGIFTERLLAWGRENRCAYVGIDPAPSPGTAERIRQANAETPDAPANRLFTALSLEVLPDLERCEVYFLDGDHNYYTVRNELEWIRRAAGPVVFAHDVSWPFARRDMYHQPSAIPPEDRHPYSENLGASLEGDALIDGGFRAPGQYAIALHAGGPRNGVLTAIEHFLSADGGRDWQAIVFPVGYGLAILYRPGDPVLPDGCRRFLDDLRAAVAVTGKFLASCEANFLQLYLYAEHVKHHPEARLQSEQAAHHRTLQAYDALHGAYDDAAAHNKALTQEYQRLLEAYSDLENEYKNLRRHCDALQRQHDHPALLHSPAPHDGKDPSPEPGLVIAGNAPASQPAG